MNILDEHSRECLAIRVKRKLNSTDVIDVLTDLFILRGVPAFIRSDNGPEFVAQAVRDWIAAVGAKTAYIVPGSPWENGYCESFNARFRDELLNGEIFYTLKEAQIIIEEWRKHYNTKRPHSALGYRLPAPERASTFWNSKIVTVSTPTVKNASRIEAEYLGSDQREYWVPCQHCGEAEVMRWACVQWQADQPETAVYVCEHCGAAWSDADRLRAIKRGEWRASAEFKGVAGFRLSGLVSPWISITEAARDFLEAKKLPETLRVWVNTYLGETWEESGEGVSDLSPHCPCKYGFSCGGTMILL